MGSKTVHMTLHDQDFVHFHDLEKSSFSHIQIVDKMSYEITKVQGVLYYIVRFLLVRISN